MSTDPGLLGERATGPRAAAPPLRAVVTGIGVIAPNGIGTEAYWDATLRGTSGIDRITRFDPAQYPSRLAGEVNLDVTGRVPGRLLPQTDRMTRLALLAAEEALADAGADPRQMPDFAAGVVTAGSAGGFEFGQKELEALWSKGGQYVSAYQSFAWFYPVNTGQISIRHGMRGPGSALVADQAGGLDAIAKARRHVRQGTPLMLTGAVDGSLCPWAWICMMSSGRLTTAEDPRRAYLPFDRDAGGHAPGEGGAHLVLEDAVAARARGVDRPYAAIAGHASTFDARPGTTEPGGGTGLLRAARIALADARVEPSDVDVVFADAAGTSDLDRAEADTLARLFGARAVPVTAPKTMTGRLLAGGGPLDVATAVLAMRDSVVPPTVHIDHEAHRDAIDLVRETPRQMRIDTALVLARGHGGFNSALVIRRVP